MLWAFPSSPGAWREAVGLHRVRPRPVDEGFVTGTCFMIRRAAFEELGGFDARFWLYGEETDLCRRAIDSGWGVMVDQAVVATHVGSGSRRTAPALVDEHFARGTERFIADREGTGARLLPDREHRGCRIVPPCPAPHADGSAARARDCADTQMPSLATPAPFRSTAQQWRTTTRSSSARWNHGTTCGDAISSSCESSWHATHSSGCCSSSHRSS